MRAIDVRELDDWPATIIVTLEWSLPRFEARVQSGEDRSVPADTKDLEIGRCAGKMELA